MMSFKERVSKILSTQISDGTITDPLLSPRQRNSHATRRASWSWKDADRRIRYVYTFAHPWIFVTSLNFES